MISNERVEIATYLLLGMLSGKHAPSEYSVKIVLLAYKYADAIRKYGVIKNVAENSDEVEKPKEEVKREEKEERKPLYLLPIQYGT